MDGREQLTIILVVQPTYLYIGVLVYFISCLLLASLLHLCILAHNTLHIIPLSVLHKLVTSGNSNSCVRVSSVVGVKEEVWACGA